MTDDEIKALLREFKKQESSPFKPTQIIWGVCLAIASYLGTSKLDSLDANYIRLDQRLYEISQQVSRQPSTDPSSAYTIEQINGKLDLIIKQVNNNTQRIDKIENR